MMDLSTLSNYELLQKLRISIRGEREATLELLYYLIELDRRALYLERGYSSLYDFCTRALLLSEGSAYRRISAARALQYHPEMKEHILEGKLSLCSIAASAKAIKAQSASVEDIVGKSKREVERLVAEPVAVKPRERVRVLVVAKPIADRSPGKTSQAETTQGSLFSAPVEETEAQQQESKEESELTEERYELKFSVSREVYEEFKAARNELSNKLKTDLSLEAVLGEILKNRHTHQARKRSSFKPRKLYKSRRISESVKREVLKRDSRQCSYCAEDGTRCSEKRYLHFDHVTPYAKGGKNDASNIRLLCSSHNRHLAKKVFGEDKVEFYTNLHR